MCCSRALEDYVKDINQTVRIRSTLSVELRMHIVSGSTYKVCQKMIVKSFGVFFSTPLYTITRHVISGKDIQKYIEETIVRQKI